MLYKLQFLIIIILFSINNVYSADNTSKFSIGVSTGVKSNKYNAQFPVLAGNGLMPYFDNSDNSGSSSISYGISVNCNIPDFDNKLSVIGRLYFNKEDFLCPQVGSNYPHIMMINNTQKTVVVRTDHSLEVSYSVMAIDLMCKYDIFSTLGVTAGISTGYVASNHYLQKYILSSPSGIKFSDITDFNIGEIANNSNSNVYIVNDKKMDNVSSLRFGLMFGLQYAIKFDEFEIIPNVNYYIPLTNVLNNESYKINYLQFGIDIRYVL